MILGGSGFSDIDKIAKDVVIKNVCKMEKLPDSSTINRFYNKYGGSIDDIAVSDSIRAIGKLSSMTVIKGLKKQKVKSITLDQDATYMKTNKHDAKMCYKGFKAYSSMTCFVADYGYCIDEEFRNGNVSPSTGILQQLLRVDKLLKSNKIKLAHLRNDSAGYQASIFNYCFENDIIFYIGTPLDSSVDNAIANIPENTWKAYYDRYGIKSDCEEISEFIHCMDKTKKSFRAIVIRKKIKSEIPNVPELLGDNYIYRVISTNSLLPAHQVVHFYNKRGECEYYIKEAKYGFDLRHLPSGQLGGNGLWFKTGILAYNIINYLKNIIFGGKYTNKEMKSIRYQIFYIAGKLVSHSRKTILKLCCSQSMLRQIKKWRLLCLE